MLSSLTPHPQLHLRSAESQHKRAAGRHNISIWCWGWCSSYELLSCSAPEHYKSSSPTVILWWAGWDFIESDNLRVRGKPFNVLEMKVSHCRLTRDLLKGIRAENVHTESTELKFHFSLWNIWIFVIISQSLDFSRLDPGQARGVWCHLTLGAPALGKQRTSFKDISDIWYLRHFSKKLWVSFPTNWVYLTVKGDHGLWGDLTIVSPVSSLQPGLSPRSLMNGSTNCFWLWTIW